MEIYNNDEQRYVDAKKRVDEIKGFYGNLASYVVVNIFLMILNLLTSPEYLWFFWPLLGWGIGIVFHGLKVFRISPFLNKEWEEKKIKQFMEEEKKNQQKWQ
jgi:hypothetical protein